MAVAFSTCPLCEATCGLRITVEDGAVTGIRGDADDVLSHGFVCPKGASLRELHDDPDRLRTPLLREPGGGLRPASWDEAFAEIDRRLPAIQAEHGRDAVAAYIGNPSAHNLSSLIYGRVVLKALRTRNLFSASTVDQYPKQMASALMFGSGATRRRARRRPHRPPADPRRQPAGLERQPADRARHARAPARDPRARRQGRGRRSAAHAHRRARPTSTTSSARAPTRCCCSRSSHVLFDEGLAEPRRAGRARRRASTRSARWPATSRPRPSPATCGIAAPEIRRMARELAAAPSGRGLRADRHDDAALRHDGQLARRRAQRPHRQPRPPRRRDVPAHRGGSANTAGEPGPRPGRGLRALAQPRARAGRGLRRAAGRRAWPRRSRRRARARSAR